MAHAAQPMRQINLKVSEKVYAKLEKLAKDADTPVSTMAGFLFDAAYAARVKGTPDADLDAHVAVEASPPRAVQAVSSWRPPQGSRPK